ncbi:MAG: FixH family protein [Thermoanaerobaculia bacterium]|nr:FixH family protein [Thermoanaerobaculia bacterium]MBP9824996.1 FixH family protein [Thermoanaerobaculia bacterium]
MPSARSNVWYRNPLVWMMIALPASSVVAGLSTVVVAFRVFDGVVVDDYYARGKAINLTIERDVAAQRRGLAAVASLTPGIGDPPASVEVTVSARDVAALPAVLKLAFLHATHGGADAQVELARTAAGLYRAALPPLAPGKYYLQIEAEDWRIVGALRQPTERTASLGPAQ